MLQYDRDFVFVYKYSLFAAKALSFTKKVSGGMKITLRNF